MDASLPIGLEHPPARGVRLPRFLIDLTLEIRVGDMAPNLHEGVLPPGFDYALGRLIRTKRLSLEYGPRPAPGAPPEHQEGAGRLSGSVAASGSPADNAATGSAASSTSSSGTSISPIRCNQ